MRVPAAGSPVTIDDGNLLVIVKNGLGEIAPDGSLVIRMCNDQEDVGLEARIRRGERRSLGYLRDASGRG
jgi:hypothetical protein